jgi:hypothetical protein
VTNRCACGFKNILPITDFLGPFVAFWPLAAVTLDRVGTAAIGGAADQNVALDSV